MDKRLIILILAAFLFSCEQQAETEADSSASSASSSAYVEHYPQKIMKDSSGTVYVMGYSRSVATAQASQADDVYQYKHFLQRATSLQLFRREWETLHYADATGEAGEMNYVGTSHYFATNEGVKVINGSGTLTSTLAFPTDTISFSTSKVFQTGVDTSSNQYFGGWVQGTGTSNVNRWAVFKLTASGTALTLADNHDPTSHGSRVTALLVDDSFVLVGGEVDDSNGDPSAALRKSTDGGSTWSSINFATDSAWETTTVTEIIKDPGGTSVFALLATKSSSHQNGWVVQKSTDSGSTWTTMDYRHFPQIGNDTRHSTPMVLAMNSTGEMYVEAIQEMQTQLGSQVYTDYRQIAARSTDSGTTWEITRMQAEFALEMRRYALLPISLLYYSDTDVYALSRRMPGDYQGDRSIGIHVLDLETIENAGNNETYKTTRMTTFYGDL